MDKDKNLSEKQNRMRERRDALKEQSKAAREYRDTTRVFAEYEEEVTVNTCIMELFHSDIDRDELNTFEGWINQGFAVRKGEKVLINLWGRPRKAKQDETEDEYQFWPLVFLFHRSQVEPLKNKQPEAAAA